MSSYLGVDPGRSKTGLALVDVDGKILALHIAMTDKLQAYSLIHFLIFL